MSHTLTLKQAKTNKETSGPNTAKNNRYYDLSGAI